MYYIVWDLKNQKNLTAKSKKVKTVKEAKKLEAKLKKNPLVKWIIIEDGRKIND